MLGRLLSQSITTKQRLRSIHEAEFSVFSQWGDDGIIQWLQEHLEIPSKTFVEFGVEDYRESTTRFLMMHNNWSGLIIDGSESHIQSITSSEYYWKYDLVARCAFVDRDNINGLISAAGFAGELGILHVDIDGNDYWIWEAISGVNPAVVILEYNSVFGSDRAITVPYDKEFQRSNAHYSNLYFGASLPALDILSRKKGYALIGCTSAGNNAYFVRKELLNNQVREVSIEDGFVDSKFRESRDTKGRLDYRRGDERIEAIRGLPVFNIETGTEEAL